MPTTTPKRGRPATGETGSPVSLYLSDRDKAILADRATSRAGRTKALRRILARYTQAVAAHLPRYDLPTWQAIIKASGRPQVTEARSRQILANMALPEAVAAEVAGLTEIEAVAVLDVVDRILALPANQRSAALAELVKG